MHVFTIETLHAKQFISGKLHTIFTVRRGGGSVMLWDCFFSPTDKSELMVHPERRSVKINKCKYKAGGTME